MGDLSTGRCGDTTLHTQCKRKCSFRCGTRIGQDLRVYHSHRSKSLSLLLAQSQAIAPPYSDTQAPISGSAGYPGLSIRFSEKITHCRAYRCLIKVTLHMNQSPSESLWHGESPLTSHSEEFYWEVFHNWLFPWGAQGGRRSPASSLQ